MEDQSGIHEFAVKPPRLTVACPVRPVKRQSYMEGASARRGGRPTLGAERGTVVQGHPHLVFTAPCSEINVLFKFLLP